MKLKTVSLIVVFCLILVVNCSFSLAEESSKPKELTIAALAGMETDPLKAIIPLWEEQYGIKINLILYPYNSLYEKIVTTMVAGVSTYDVILIDDPWMPKLGKEGWLLPLDKELGYEKEDDIMPVSYDLGTWPPPYGPIPPGEENKEKELLALPLIGNLEFFMFRSDLIPEEPITWDDVYNIGSKFYDPKNGSFGYVIRGAAGNPVISEFYPMLVSFGGRIFDENWNVALNSPESVAALEMLLKLKTISPSGVEAYDAAERSREVAAGRAVQALIWPGEASQMIENPEVSQVVGKMKYIKIPKGLGKNGRHASLMGNWLLAIPKTAPNPEWAFKFILWVTSSDIQKIYAKNGGVPFRVSTLSDPELIKTYPFYPAMLDSLKIPPDWRPRTEEWFAVENILGTYVNAALSGQVSSQEAIEKAAKEIEEHMKEKGYL